MSYFDNTKPSASEDIIADVESNVLQQHKSTERIIFLLEASNNKIIDNFQYIIDNYPTCCVDIEGVLPQIEEISETIHSASKAIFVSWSVIFENHKHAIRLFEKCFSCTKLKDCRLYILFAGKSTQQKLEKPILIQSVKLGESLNNLSYNQANNTLKIVYYLLEKYKELASCSAEEIKNSVKIDWQGINSEYLNDTTKVLNRAAFDLTSMYLDYPYTESSDDPIPPIVAQIIQTCKFEFNSSTSITYVQKYDIKSPYNEQGENMSNYILGEYKVKEIETEKETERKIILYPNAIDALAKKNIFVAFDDSTVRYALYVWVFLHELAHAIMDEKFETKLDAKLGIITSLINKDGYKFRNEDYYNAMEESLANHLSLLFLEYIYDSNSDEVKIAKIAIEKYQPKEYQFGLNQHDISADWRKWAYHKTNTPQNIQKFISWHQIFIKNGISNYAPDDYDKLFK